MAGRLVKFHVRIQLVLCVMCWEAEVGTLVWRHCAGGDGLE